MNRRSFFKAIGAVAAAVGFPIKDAAPASTLVETTMADAKATYPWTWMISLDGGYTFDELEVDSKDGAVAHMAMLPDYERDAAVVAECQQQDFDLRINFDWLLDHLCDQNDAIIGDGDFISVTDEQGDELEREVNAVIKAWANRHDLYLTAWAFAGTRNHIRAADLPQVERVSRDHA